MSIQDRIDWLQRYIIVHSYIYYMLNDNIISDYEYDAKARQLAKLKNDYPALWKKSEYYKQFGDDYNGATGFTLYYDLDDYQKGIVQGIVNSIYNQLGRAPHL